VVHASAAHLQKLVRTGNVCVQGLLDQDSGELVGAYLFRRAGVFWPDGGEIVSCFAGLWLGRFDGTEFTGAFWPALAAALRAFGRPVVEEPDWATEATARGRSRREPKPGTVAADGREPDPLQPYGVQIEAVGALAALAAQLRLRPSLGCPLTTSRMAYYWYNFAHRPLAPEACAFLIP
jgi:hypothetical protein